MRWLFGIVLAAAIAGCSNSPPPAAEPKEAKQDFPAPEATIEQKDPLYEQLHAGMFQADSVVKKLGDALDIAKALQAKAKGDLVAPMKDMVAVLDDAGSSLAELSGGDPPTEEQVKKAPGTYQGKRDLLVKAVNDALHDLREQEGVAASLAEEGPPDGVKQFAELDKLLNACIDDLLGTLSALGGHEDSSQPTPDTGDTNQKPPAGFTG